MYVLIFHLIDNAKEAFFALRSAIASPKSKRTFMWVIGQSHQKHPNLEEFISLGMPQTVSDQWIS